jgi:hypothetical protein
MKTAPALLERVRMACLWIILFALPLALDACAKNTHIHV